jgi:gamma-glutamyltranspeptidase
MSLADAVSTPRFTIPAPRTGQTLWVESALAKSYGDDLTRRGELWLSKDSRNAVQAVGLEQGVFVAAADARKQGSALTEKSPAQ